jgi:hypothetical protein
MFLTILFLCFPANFQETEYVLVLKQGKIIRSLSEPKLEGSNCVFTTADGTVSALPAKQVDLEATREKNAELAQLRELKKAEEAAAAAARQKEQEEAQAARMSKTIAVEDALDIPVSAPNPNDTVYAGPDGAADEGALKTQVFPNTNNDPVFIAQESLGQGEDGSFVRLTVKCAHAAGVRNVAINATCWYEDGSTRTEALPVNPASLAMDASGTATFRLGTLPYTRYSFDLVFQLPN